MSLVEKILERATTRFFREDEIEEEKIRTIAEAAVAAPNANNAQQWYFVFVKSPDLREKLRDIIVRAYLRYIEDYKDFSEEIRERVKKAIQDGLYAAPLYVAAYVDTRTRVLKEEKREFEREMAVHSVCAAIENMILAAWFEGIGSVWLGVVKYLEEEINKLLLVPKGLELIAVIAFGIP